MSKILHVVNHSVIDKAFRLLPDNMGSLNARAQLLKTGLQESLLVNRRQLVGSPPRPIGPAAGLWQFERGGIRGVLNHEDTRHHLRKLAAQFGVAPTEQAIWEAIQINDILAAGLARLNYWWNPKSLPDFKDVDESWEQYLFCWRPGAAKRDPVGLRTKWERNHASVVEYLTDS